MEATARFQQALPYLLLPVSESLSALHSARGRLHCSPGTTDPNVCPACGNCLHTGTSQTRLIRRSGSRKSRVFQTTCLACGRLHRVPLQLHSSAKPSARHIPPVEPNAGANIPLKAGSPQLPTALPAPRKMSPRENGERIAPSSSTSQTNRTGPVANNISRVRPKKKAGLQAMLARNREQEDQRTKKQTDLGGLSAFLNGL